MKLKYNWLALLALPLIFFVACDEADEAEAGSNALIGTWSMAVTEYSNSTCSGDGEIVDEGTITFTATKSTITYTSTFEDWCDGTITDGVCDEGDGDTYTESDFEEDCNYEGDGTYTDGVCTSEQADADYTLSNDSITMNLTETFGVPESYASMCVDEGGIYENGICTISFEQTMSIVIDGNTVTLTYTDIDEDYPEDSYCEVTVLTKQ